MTALRVFTGLELARMRAMARWGRPLSDIADAVSSTPPIVAAQLRKMGVEPPRKEPREGYEWPDWGDGDVRAR